jgi:hypothetical protein
MKLHLVIEDLEKILRIIAILIGGIWAYYKFFRGRVFKYRLEPKVSVTLEIKEDTYVLNVGVSLKNPGPSHVRLSKEYSVLRVFGVKNESIQEIQTAQWERLLTKKIFEDHSWIESSEFIEEECLIFIPRCRIVNNYLAFKIESVITLVTDNRWTSSKIVVCKEDNAQHGITATTKLSGSNILNRSTKVNKTRQAKDRS